ncbi:MAG: hypothetical protein GWO24_38265, partial [Akkermansiaceae bacterium]|nr:hypothetical protein [Akkermansiaceae bacterium]
AGLLLVGAVVSFYGLVDPAARDEESVSTAVPGPVPACPPFEVDCLPEEANRPEAA